MALTSQIRQLTLKANQDTLLTNSLLSLNHGLNLICVTRKIPLGFYIKRCREVFMKHNYKWVHLHALGAAIPHLVLLASSLPQTLPFPAIEITTSVRTLTVECRDEILPDDEDEDINYRIRGKSALRVIIKVGDAPLPDDVYGGVDYDAGEDSKESSAGGAGTKGKERKKGSRNRGERGRRKPDDAETKRQDVTKGRISTTQRSLSWKREAGRTSRSITFYLPSQGEALLLSIRAFHNSFN